MSVDIDNLQEFSTNISQYGSDFAALTKTLTGDENDTGTLNNIVKQIKEHSQGFLHPDNLAVLNDISAQAHTLQGSMDTLNYNLNDVTDTLMSSLPQIQASQLLNKKLSEENVQRLTKQSQELDQEIANKTRMTEINNYYSNMNTHINIIMRNLVIILAVIILFTILSKKGIIPGNAATFISVICVIAIIIYVVYSIYDINVRNKFNFDEYVIPFDLEAKHLESSGNTTYTDIRDVLGGELLSGINQLQNFGTCFGDNCCEPGTVYDICRNACIISCPPGLVYKQIVDPTTGLTDGSCADPS